MKNSIFTAVSCFYSDVSKHLSFEDWEGKNMKKTKLRLLLLLLFLGGLIILPQKAKARPYLCRGAALRCRRKNLAEEHEFQNRLADISEKSIGNLKLGIPSYRGQICLPEILPRFYAKWPNIKIELCNESSNTMEERLYNGELDIFIGVMYQDNPKLESSTLLTDHIYLSVPTSFCSATIPIPGRP